jgi:rRNA maturation protein Nop10
LETSLNRRGDNAEYTRKERCPEIGSSEEASKAQFCPMFQTSRVHEKDPS